MSSGTQLYASSLPDSTRSRNRLAPRVRMEERAKFVGWMTRRRTMPERHDTENELRGQTFSEDALDRVGRILDGTSTSEESS